MTEGHRNIELLCQVLHNSVAKIRNCVYEGERILGAVVFFLRSCAPRKIIWFFPYKV